MFVTGDFNVPEITWARDQYDDHVRPLLKRLSRRACCLLENIDAAGLTQYVTEPTRGNNFLDLIFSRYAHVDAIVRKSVLLSDHDELCCKIHVKIRKHATVNRVTAYNYKRADWEGLRRCLELIPWSNFADMEVDAAIDMFYDFLDAAISDHVPKVVMRRGYPPWFDAEVRRALREKEAAFRRKKPSSTVDTESDFR